MIKEGINSPLTLTGVIAALPLILALIGGVSAYNNLQLQVTELKVTGQRDSVYLKETLDEIRSDVRALKVVNEVKEN